MITARCAARRRATGRRPPSSTAAAATCPRPRRPCAAAVVLALGRIAHDAVLGLLPVAAGRPRPRFAHAAVHSLPGGVALVDSFHVSQQNTFTGRLTAAMFDAVLARCRRLGPTRVGRIGGRDRRSRRGDVMVEAEGRSYAFDGPEKVTPGVLEVFPYEYPEREAAVEIVTDEWNCVCRSPGCRTSAR